MKLGEMLVRDGRITPVQLQGAIAHQAQAGGRIGSILVELGSLDAETLTVYLGLELGMPIATGATLERCKRSAVRLLSPQQAARYRCVPIVIQGQTLILAIEDPLDMPTLDALHNMTGYRVLPRVAPEIRIHYYLERFYGVPRPQRFVALGDSPRGNPAIGSHTGGLPGPPLPGLPPRRTAPIAAPTPRPTLQRSPPPPVLRPPPVPSGPPPVAMAPPPPPPAPSVIDTLPDPEPPEMEAAPAPVVPLPPPPTKEEQEALEIDANDLVDELDADEADLASHAAEPGTEPSRRATRSLLRAPSDDEETEPGDDGSAARTGRRGRWRDTIEEADREARGGAPRVDDELVDGEAAARASAGDADAAPSEIQDPITRPVAAKARGRARGREAIGRPGSGDTDERDTERAVHPVLSLDGALAVMASTDQRGAIADAILGFAARLFDVAVLCLVRDHMALGWKGFGSGIDDDRIEALLIPLEMSSIYQLSVRSRDLFRGHAFPAALHDHVFKVLRCQAPLYSMVVPISIGPRVVNLLYGHKRDGGDLNEDEEMALRQVAAAAGEAYVRLISVSKAQRKSA